MYPPSKHSHGFKLNVDGKKIQLTAYGWFAVLIAGLVAAIVATIITLKIVH